MISGLFACRRPEADEMISGLFAGRRPEADEMISGLFVGRHPEADETSAVGTSKNCPSSLLRRPSQRHDHFMVSKMTMPVYVFPHFGAIIVFISINDMFQM
jgi:hypothetical protein